ncbi:hypothetical protein SD960_07390 [Flavobacterium sp. MMLR14_040]|uniref:hypothetical protein n=1 Tax=Flavobacterium sp. MMLR14_040 TaxID=3093843 RepID=UPI00299065EF|nr:hypothetical protein [Flavobacterium sp. MMLR14_040]MDW8849910.1 hypothetical protein [Flavobacterium sp. MMLR14_040]
MKNLKNVPEIIVKSKCIGHPINFKWTKKKIDALLDPLEGNEELEIALAQINQKAAVGLTAALLEWVNWRFTGYTKAANDIDSRIEALWCSIADRDYSHPLDFDTDLNIPATNSVNGPIWIALMNVKMVDVRYRKGSYYLQNELVGLVLLARHICPKKKVFDKWFSSTIIELARLFPCQYNDEDIDETDEAIYDSSNEPVICREFFFDPKYKYSPEAATQSLNEFIDHVDQKRNSFLQIEEMVY